MLDRACGGFGNRVGEVRRSAFRDNDRARATAFGCSDNRSKVVRVLDTIEENENRVGRDVAQEVIGVRIARGGRNGQDALVICVVSQAVESNAGLATNRNPGAPRFFEHLAQP